VGSYTLSLILDFVKEGEEKKENAIKNLF